MVLVFYFTFFNTCQYPSKSNQMSLSLLLTCLDSSSMDMHGLTEKESSSGTSAMVDLWTSR